MVVKDELSHRRRTPAWLPARSWVAAAVIALGLLGPVVLLPRAVVAPFSANVSNGPSTVSAYAWKSYVTTLQSDGVPTNWWRLGEANGNNTATAQVGGVNGNYVNGHGAQAGPIVNDANTAATLNGSNQCIQTSDIRDNANRAAFSVELWFRRTAAPGGSYSRLVTKNSGSGGWELAFNASDAANNKNEIYFLRGDSGGGASYTGSGMQMALNTWYHIVATYDGNTMAFYVNGDLMGSTASTINLPDTGTAVQIGCLGTANYLTGAIDEVALYSVALTPRQVLSHYYAGLAGK